MPNRLARETSPYLLQHRDNPVDWYPWGEEALERARKENKPILLSIGYSACHWCHVMAHESFEIAEIAELMNANFVNIKVDREERPDLDQIYQNVAQAITRGGGWPLTVFLTPDLRPFFGGTYFPPEDRWGRPGFPRLLRSISDAYRDDPESVGENARKLTEVIRSLESVPSPGSSESGEQPGERKAISLAELSEAASILMSTVDWEEGGLGGAPKFPNSMMLDFLWRLGLETGNGRFMEASLLTLRKMASGGIYDQLGGGFHRYSVDDAWSVPHFEKMLYDNGLLLRSYSQALLRGESLLDPPTRELFGDVVRETLDYLLEEMVSPEGAFYAAQDADSEGVEGKFFVWDRKDLSQLLSPEEAGLVSAYYGVSEDGNFEHGKTVLYRALPLDRAAASAGITEKEAKALLRSARAKLLEARRRRIPPGTDTKILASWNGLAICGIAWASRALRAIGDLDGAVRAWNAASRAFDFLAQVLSRNGHRLYSVYGPEGARLNAYLDDYAFLAQAALDLARFEPDDVRRDLLLERAERWVQVTIRHFSDPDGAGYFFTSDDHESLIQRPKTIYDQAIPSGTGVLLGCLLALGEIDRGGRGEALSVEAERQLGALAPSALRRAYGYGELLNVALLEALGPVVISGPASPDSVVAVDDPHVFRRVEEPGALEGGYVICHHRSCGLPLATADEARRAALGILRKET